MHIAIRLRIDFTVTDAARLLAAARAAYARANPGAGPQDAVVAVTGAADAVFTILESEGLLGHAADRALAARAGDRLQAGGWRAQVTLNEALRLPPGSDCTDHGDVFALPPST